MHDEVIRAAKIIRRGGIILYPTDTIWGIGCDATCSDAVARIYEIKKRADSKSMLVLVHQKSMLNSYVDRIPEQADDILAEAKKPTTIIYPGAKNLAPNLIASDGSLGIRITSDPFCRKLIAETGLPLVSTSANISGEASPSHFHEITEPIKQELDYVVGWRRDDRTAATPSAIVKANLDGSILVIRP